MKKALFIGHTYHLKTKSSVFAVEILQKEYEVSMAYIDPRFPISYDELKVEKNAHFDLLVIWQVMPHTDELKKLITWDYGVFFPMYDHYKGMGGFYDFAWNGYAHFLIICFSKVLYEDAIKAGFDARYIQYFPQPKPVQTWGDEHGVFFWQRITKLNCATFAKAIQPLDIRKVHLHKAIDPDNIILPPSAYGTETSNFFHHLEVSESVWFDEKAQLRDTMSKYALYMTPRFYEGIGMSFLDAMAMGRCVIAPNLPTMNEYIIDGVNGILYPWDEQSGTNEGCKPLQRTIREIQASAYQTIQEGYEHWEREQGRILEWCREQAQPQQNKLFLSAVQHGWTDWSLEQQPWPDAQQLDKYGFTKIPVSTSDHLTPEISVITVVYNLIENNRKETFLQCLDSVQEQQGVNMEHVIIDGGSTDGTMELIKEYPNKHITIRCLSLRDNGIYEAMNRGIVWARGTYIIFLNSDDYYHNPKGLQQALATIQSTGCDFTFAPIIALNDTVPHSPHVTPADYLDEIFFHAVFSHQTVLTKRQLMVDMHGFDLSYRSAADYDFILRLLLTGHKGCYVNLSFVSYRMTGQSSTNILLSTQETSFVYRRLYALYADTQLTREEAIHIHTQGRLPRNHPALKHHLKTILEKSFVGVPKNKSYSYKFYLPEICFVCKELLSGHFKHLGHFFLILFNSRFNREWYLHQNKDVFSARQAPAAHYLDYGWREGRDPSLRFSTKSYLTKNPDVAEMDICPLIHWKLKGKREHRSL